MQRWLLLGAWLAALPCFVVAAPSDPYASARYRLLVGGRTVAGAENAAVLRASGEVVNYRAGGTPGRSLKSPGRMKYDEITLERGITRDAGFADRASRTSQYGESPGAQTSLANFRKSVVLQFAGETGGQPQTYRFANCWVSEYLALPKPSAGANAVAIQHIKLLCLRVPTKPPRKP